MTQTLSLTETTRARVRIAVPSFRSEPAGEVMPASRRTAPAVEEFKRLLDAALTPDIVPLQLTRGERRQLALARRVRKALYDAA